MENWIGIGVWIVMGAFIALVMRVAIKRPEETPGHVPVLVVLGAFGAVIGGMLGVGIFEFDDPLALSAGGMGGAGQGDFASAFSDVFDDLFGDFMGGQRGGGGRRAARGADLRYNLGITLEDAYRGMQKSINVPTSVACDSCNGSGSEGGAEPTTCPTCSGMGKVRAQQGFFTVERTCPTCSGMGKVRAQQGFFTVERTCPTCQGVGQMIKNPCKTCHGQGRVEKGHVLSVNIPAGVETGTRIRLAGEGEAGMRGGPSGDLYIFIQVAEHPLFERDGVSLHCRVPVSMTSAAMGGDIEVPTIDGGRSRVKIPAGSQSGRQMRLRGKGMPALRGGGSGDMMIELAVETPVNLTSRQKELLQEFEKESSNNNPESSSFFSSVKSFWDSMKG